MGSAPPASAPEKPAPGGRLHRLLRPVVAVRPAEIAGLLLGFGYFFCLLCSYYLLRPLRDAMGLVGGSGELQWLFTGTFVVMLALVPVFGLLVTRLPPQRFVPLIYRFFCLNILIFCGLIAADVAGIWVARVFFVWISVYNLFVVSVFWSVVADCFTSEQGRRLFGFIAAGGTLGTFVGPGLAALMVTAFSPVSLTLLAALLLELAAQCGRLLICRRPARHDHQATAQAATMTRTGGGILAGLTLIIRSPYLIAIVCYMLLHTATSTFLYFEQARIVEGNFADTETRTQFFAIVDLTVSAVTLGLQVLLTGPLLRRFGIGAALALLPVVAIAAFASIAVAPVPAVLAIAQGIKRAADYAIARPAREVLFTVVSRETKYKAKNAIETLVYRGGDMASGWISAGLAALGVGFAGVTVLALPLAGLWIVLSRWLGRRQDNMAAALTQEGLMHEAQA